MVVHDFGKVYFERFAAIYEPFHYPLITILTSLSVVSNMLNVLIFTRKHMRLPANTILASLAFLMASHALITLVIANMESTYLSETMSGVMVMWVLFNLNETIHNILVFHSLLLAMIRFLVLQSPFMAAYYCTVRNIKHGIYVLYPVIIFLSCPTFMSTHVCYRTRPSSGIDSNMTEKIIGYCFNTWAWEIGITKYNFWFIGTVFKLLPCTLLMVLTTLLTCQLQKIKERHRLLKGHRGTTVTNRRSSNLRHTQQSNINRGSSAIPIIAAIVIFVLVETPQGIQNILTGIYGAQFSRQVTFNLAQFTSMVTEFSNLILFGVYCATNPLFRTTLANLLKNMVCTIWLRRNEMTRNTAREPCGIELQEGTRYESYRHRATCDKRVRQSDQGKTRDKSAIMVYKKMEWQIPLLKKQKERSSSSTHDSSKRIVLRMTFESPRLHYKR